MYPSPPTRVRFPLKDQEFEMRAPHPRDVDALLEAVRESLPELQCYMLWPHFGDTLEPEFQHQRLIAAQAAYLEGKDFVYHLWCGDQVVGGVGLHPRALNPKALEVGYWIRSSWVGRGLATAMVQSAAVFNFEVLENERLQCLVNAANRASLRVAQKCGFRLEGELKYWESQGNSEHRRQGFRSSPSSFMHSITSDDLDSLQWYALAVERTEVLP